MKSDCGGKSWFGSVLALQSFATPVCVDSPTSLVATTMSKSPEPTAPSFPKNIGDFDADERISFSKLDSKYILVTDDGQEYEFDEKLKRWVPVVRPPSTQ